ncbi:patatin-like phospholipase family protein [Ideonella sp. BN130291]|nr:patatin-like phospholipase family protein [Ideonella sp. BN130291]
MNPPTTPPVVQPPAVVVAPPKPVRPPRIGLALGGGAARGFAHIGVIQVLEEHGIKPDLVVGTSAGSLVAALYAAGRSGAELGTLAQTMDETAITDWAYPGRALIRGEALARYVRDHTGGRLIEQMKLPLGIVATDLDSGAPILFQRGDPGMAVRASSAVPAVFQPVKIGSREYVDGGLVSPVPVRFARQMGAELVIAVDISAAPEGNPTGDAMRMLLQTFAIMGRSINQYELKDADIVLRPKLNGVSSADFSVRAKSIQAGREIATALLPDLKARITALTK